MGNAGLFWEGQAKARGWRGAAVGARAVTSDDDVASSSTVERAAAALGLDRPHCRGPRHQHGRA
jgi:hypothetical protein